MRPSRWANQQRADATPRATLAALCSNAIRTACLGAVLTAISAPLHAQERLVRTFGPENGLTSPPVWALAQDSVGFLWIGTEGGLLRFDGTEFRRWAADSIQGRVHSVVVSPEGRIAAVEIDGRAFEITPSGARGISSRVNQRTHFNALVYDRRGVLWLIDGDAVKYRRPDSQWQALPAGAFAGEQLFHIKPNRLGAIDVLTGRGVWRIHPDSAPRRLVQMMHLVDVASLEDGRTIALGGASIVAELADGQQRKLLSPPTVSPNRAIGLAERHGTIWISRDNSLVALRPDEPPEVIPFTGRITFGGPMLVDREGSLWIGSNALHQFPEPETWNWSQVGDLDLRWARFLEKTGGTVWVGTWGHMSFVRRSTSGWQVAKGPSTLAHLCTDSAGVIWTGYATGSGPASVVEISDTTVKRHPVELRSRVFGCTPAREGGVWLGTGSDIVNVNGGTGAIRAVPSPPAPEGMQRLPALHDSQGRLWVGMPPDRICSAHVQQLFAASEHAWSCDSVPGFKWPNGIIEMPSGALWAGSEARGMLAYGLAGWQPLPMEDLPTRTVFALVPSPAGGAWMAGHGFLQRIQERPGRDAEVIERITQWHGVPGPASHDVLEEDDGTIWIAYDGGVVRVPATVRFAAQAAPGVALVEASVDGGPIAAQSPLRLPHHRNRVELRFAALSFRNPALLQHQVRLGPNEPWSESRRSPSFRWVDLRPGDYQVEYRASLDGRNWSTEPVSFAFTVLSPWYATPWAIALGFLVMAGFAWSVYRARVAYLLGLERQRTRIAMDLHDEVGSGLASVGILSGVLAADSLDAEERRRAASEIASAAEELGNSLSDIVWSLDPHTATLAELASRLAEHGERLCATGDTLFTTRFADSWPAERLDVALRRNVLLVGLEALHNGVRHAHAREVLLSLIPINGRWELTVRDDGLGMPTSRQKNGRGGHGLRAMRRRAEEIGAQLNVRSAPDEGTTITLRFGLRPSRFHRNGAIGGRVRSLFTARPA